MPPHTARRGPECGAGAQVKEGHDSTVRPKLNTWEFDTRGRRFLDEWKADGKPMLNTKVLGRVRFTKMFFALMLPVWVVAVDWGQQEHVMSEVQRRYWGWWGSFARLDDVDVAKALTVRYPRIFKEGELRRLKDALE